MDNVRFSALDKGLDCIKFFSIRHLCTVIYLIHHTNPDELFELLCIRHRPNSPPLFKAPIRSEYSG